MQCSKYAKNSTILVKNIYAILWEMLNIILMDWLTDKTESNVKYYIKLYCLLLHIYHYTE